MKSHLLDEYYFKLKLIGIYQILGGVVGVGLTIWLITMLGTIQSIMLGILSFAFIVYFFSIVTGIGLIVRKERLIPLSIFLNIPQVIFFFFNKYSFKISTGFPLYLIFELDKLKTRIKFETPIFRITYWDTTSLKIVGINLVSILMIYFLLKLRSQINSEKSKLSENFNCR